MPAAARGVKKPEPALPDELLPESLGHRLGLRHALPDKDRGALVFEEPPSALPQQLLLFGKADIHAYPARR